MLKTALYGFLFVIGTIAAFVDPFWGGVAAVETYLLHPAVLAPELDPFRIQFVVSLVFIISYVLRRPTPLPRCPNDQLAIYALPIYVGVVFFSLLFAGRPSVGLNRAIDLSKTVVVTLMFLRILNSERRLRIFFWAILLGGFHGAFMHTVGVNLGYLPPRLGRGEYGAFPDMQGSVMTVLFPCFLMQVLCGENFKKRIFSAIALVFVTDSIVNTYQRTFFVALAAELAYLILIVPQRVRVTLVPVVTVGALIAGAMFMPSDYRDWINTVQDYESEASASSRIEIGKASLAMLAENPQGVGYRNYQYISPNYLDDRWLTPSETGERVRAAHSTYFTVACETGVVGFMLYAFVFFHTGKLLRKCRLVAGSGELANMATGVEVGLVGWAVAGFFQSLHEEDVVFWCVSIAVAMYRLLPGRTAGRNVPNMVVTNNSNWC